MRMGNHVSMYLCNACKVHIYFEGIDKAKEALNVCSLANYVAN